MVTLESWRQQNSTPTIAQDTNGLAHWNAVLTSKHCLPSAKMALQSFLPLQGQFSLCCRQALVDNKELLSLPPALGKGATVKLRGDRSYCTAKTGGHCWGVPDMLQEHFVQVKTIQVQECRQNSRTPPGPCYSLHQQLSPWHS